MLILGNTFAEAVECLNTGYQFIDEWISENRLSLNTGKTKIMVFKHIRDN